MKVTKVISGGQTGVDRAALDAAMELGIPVGGWCPLGRRAEDGKVPDEYPLQEMASAAYPPRTKRNIEDAHATLILAMVSDHSELTGGTKLTFDLAYEQGGHGAGLFLADLRRGGMEADCVAWLRECLAQGPVLGGQPAFVLNVAGPRESSHPGIHAMAKAFMLSILREVCDAQDR